MGVRLDTDRRAVGVTWLDEETGDNPLPGEQATITAVNVATGDIGERVPIPNKGYGALFFPGDFTGTDDVTVEDELGNKVTGTIEV